MRVGFAAIWVCGSVVCATIWASLATFIEISVGVPNCQEVPDRFQKPPYLLRTSAKQLGWPYFRERVDDGACLTLPPVCVSGAGGAARRGAQAGTEPVGAIEPLAHGYRSARAR